MRLTQFKVLTFDCYGTLIDWETGMIEALAPLTRARRPRAFARPDPGGACPARIGAAALTPAKRYSDLLAAVHKRLAEEWGVRHGLGGGAAYGDSIKHWPAFPDSAEALRYLDAAFQAGHPLQCRQ